MSRERETAVDTVRISSEPEAGPEDIAVVREGLHRFNFDATGFREVRDVTVFVRDHHGAIKGGLLGYVWGGWLHITELWLSDECRGDGLGEAAAQDGRARSGLHPERVARS